MFRPWKFPWPWRWLSNQICQALSLIGGSSNWPSMKLTACSDSTWKLMVGGSFPILSFWGKIMPFLVHPWITCHSCFFLEQRWNAGEDEWRSAKGEGYCSQALGGKNGRWEKTGCWERELFESTGQDRYVSMTCIFIYNWYIYIYIYIHTCRYYDMHITYQHGINGHVHLRNG